MLLKSAPYFLVADLGRTIAFYEKLGFRAVYFGGRPPIFSIIERDGLTVMLRLALGASRIVPGEKQGATWDAFFWVDNADALAGELARAGVTLVYGPVLQADYNMKEFAVRDPDGHVVGFGEQL